MVSVSEVVYIYIERWMLKEYKIKEGIYAATVLNIFDCKVKELANTDCEAMRALALDINLRLNINGRAIDVCLPVSDIGKRYFLSLEDLKQYRLKRYNKELLRITKKIDAFEESNILN